MVDPRSTGGYVCRTTATVLILLIPGFDGINGHASCRRDPLDFRDHGPGKDSSYVLELLGPTHS